MTLRSLHLNPGSGAQLLLRFLSISESLRGVKLTRFVDPLELRVKRRQLRHLRAGGQTTAKGLAPNRFDLQWPSRFKINQGRRLVGAHCFSAFHLLQGRGGGQGIPAFIRGRDYFIHQCERLRAKSIASQNRPRIKTAGGHRQTVEWDVPDQLAPTLQRQICRDGADDATPLKLPRDVVRSRRGIAVMFGQRQMSAVVNFQ